MLRTAKSCAPITRKPQLYGEILRDLLETLFACSPPAACGAFSSETSLFLFTEAVVTLAGFFCVCVFFVAHITLRCPHDLNAWNRLVLYSSWRSKLSRSLCLIALLLHLQFKYPHKSDIIGSRWHLAAPGSTTLSPPQTTDFFPYTPPPPAPPKCGACSRAKHPKDQPCSVRMADVSRRSSPLRDVSTSLSSDERGETSAVRRLLTINCVDA